MTMLDGYEQERGLRAVRAAAEALVVRLGLRALAVPAELRRIDGTLRDRPVSLRMRRFTGEGRVVLTIAEVVEQGGALCAVTVIGMPADGSLAPVLGIDLVALGGSLSLIAVDLAPTDAAVWDAHAEPLLARLHHASEAAVVPRRWPGFAVEVFSRRALLAGARRGGEVAALDAVARFAVSLAPLYAGDEPDRVDPARAGAAAERRRGWCRAERRNRREHDALTRMFGAGPAAATLDLLFPVEGAGDERDEGRRA
jgi:hypothetical protein